MKLLALILLVLATGCSRSERQTSTESRTAQQATPSPGPPTDGSPQPSTPNLPGPKSTPLVTVTKPTQGEQVTSPLTVWGEARGPWYFEASFPVKLLDAEGRVLATGPAQAKGEWMTEDFVPFEVTLRFTSPGSGTGRVVLEKSNASGLPEHADEVVIPVRF